MNQPQNNYKYSLQEVHDLLVRRDLEDAEISKNNRANLFDKGMTAIEPKRFIKVNTGEIVGIDNVVRYLIEKILKDDQIISLQGLSGVGKSSTAKALKHSLNGLSFSFGEIFRYLAYKHYFHDINDFNEIIEPIYYQQIENNLCLFCAKENITHELSRHLTEPSLVSKVPSVAAQTQDIAIQFVKREMERIIAESNCKIIIEGRDYTLDFLPSDLRIELYADPMIRAKRRLNQDID